MAEDHVRPTRSFAWRPAFASPPACRAWHDGCFAYRPTAMADHLTAPTVPPGRTPDTAARAASRPSRSVPRGHPRPALPLDAHASFLSPEAEDTMATFLALFVLFVVPVVLIVALLDGAHPAGEDRAQAAPSAVRGHPHAVPAVARVRRPAVAAGLDLGVLEAGHAQAGVRHRQGRARRGVRCTPSTRPAAPAKACASGWRASRRSGISRRRPEDAPRRSGRARSQGCGRAAGRWKSCSSASTPSSSG